MSLYLTDYPTSHLDPALMAILAYTAAESVLYDFSSTQDYYILAAPTLYQVGSQYAFQWFGLNGGNSIKTVNYPFNPNGFNPRRPPIILGISPNAGSAGTAVTIVGENFSSVTNVNFDGTSAGFTIAMPTAITTQVP